jgi:hypothetical protein
MRSRIAGVLILCGALFFLDSCKDDPAPIAGISFELENESTTESDGTIKSFHPLLWQSYASTSGAKGTATGREFKVKLLLDKAAPETTVISFTLSGTAIKNSASAVGDYSIEGSNITIDKGATEAYITLTLYEDFDFFELDSDDLFKTIIITLDKIISGPAVIDETNTVYTLTVNEDDLLTVLQWNLDKTTALDVDMDMLLWAGSTSAFIGSTQGYKASEYSSKVGTEYFSIPGGFPNATYGLSHVYYSGTASPLDFIVWFVGKVGATTYTLDNPLKFAPNPKYTTANINKYDDATVGSTPKIIQTIVKSGLSFTSVSPISVPASGSRVGGNDFNGVSLRKAFSTRELRDF